MLYYAWSLHTCIHMSKMIYCIIRTSHIRSWSVTSFLPAHLLFTSGFTQTLGIDHAMASFIWLCGPITGFIVSSREDTATIAHVQSQRMQSLTYLTGYPLTPGSTLCWGVEWQMPLQVRKETALHFGWMHVDMCRCECYHVSYVFVFPLFFPLL
jgi:hypothetical protein